MVIGTYHTYPGSLAQREHNAFTLHQFLDANIASFPIYLGGKLSYNDPQLNAHYELVPEGMVSRFVPVKSTLSMSKKAITNADTVPPLQYDDITPAMYVRILHHSWDKVNITLSPVSLPDPVQYPEETWEWTIGRDYRDRIIGENCCCFARHRVHSNAFMLNFALLLSIIFTVF